MSEVKIERDLMGTIHIKLGEFDFVQIQYQYPYTDNAGTMALAERIAAMITTPQPEHGEREAFEAWWLSPSQQELRDSCAKGWAERVWNAALAAAPKSPAPEQAGVPEGWRLVPVEPTEVMKAAGCRALGALHGHYGAERCWEAMLNAAPTPPAQPAPDVSALVEALELARRTLAMAAIEGEVTRRIDSALAAHRKQGGGA